LDSRSKGRGFDFWSGRYQVVSLTLGWVTVYGHMDIM